MPSRAQQTFLFRPPLMYQTFVGNTALQVIG